MDKDNQKTGWEKMSETDEIRHQQTIVVEGLRSDFKFVIEHMTGIEERLSHKMDEKFARQDDRFDRIEVILKMHSEMLQRHEVRLDSIDTRLDRMETKLDVVGVKVDKNESDISQFKQAVGH